MKINYSFSLPTQGSALAKPPEKIVEYSFSEFLLDLPDHWREVPTSENNTLSWASDVAGASITVSADFYEVPDEKAAEVAQLCLSGRHSAMESWAPGEVAVLHESVKPYSGGGGLELTYAAKIPGNTYLYLGYVSARKIFNFALTCGPDSSAAEQLYNDLVSQRLRVKLP